MSSMPSRCYEQQAASDCGHRVPEQKGPLGLSVQVAGTLQGKPGLREAPQTSTTCGDVEKSMLTGSAGPVPKWWAAGEQAPAPLWDLCL